MPKALSESTEPRKPEFPGNCTAAVRALIADTGKRHRTDGPHYFMRQSIVLAEE